MTRLFGVAVRKIALVRRSSVPKRPSPSADFWRLIIDVIGNGHSRGLSRDIAPGLGEQLSLGEGFAKGGLPATVGSGDQG